MAQQAQPENQKGWIFCTTLKLDCMHAFVEGKRRNAYLVLPKPKDGHHHSKDTDGHVADGVVIFMHGFSQGPEAYARTLTDLADRNNLVVIAPVPGFSGLPKDQQDIMVEAAAIWRSAIAEDNLPDQLKGKGYATKPVFLLAHSIGGGLAPYVVAAAAHQKQPYTAAHVLAPDVAVVDNYRYDKRIDGHSLLDGVDTKWGVQLGAYDMLSPPPAVEEFIHWLRKQGKLAQAHSRVRYPLGTHVGFQDQLVAGRCPLVDILLALVFGVFGLLMPRPSLRISSSVSNAVGQFAAPPPPHKQQAASGPANSAPVIDGPVDVTLPNEVFVYITYILLAVLITYWAAVEASTPVPIMSCQSICKILLVALAVGGWLYLQVYPYEASTQRPEARHNVERFFKQFLP